MLSSVITLVFFYVNLSPEIQPPQILRASLQPTMGKLVGFSKRYFFGRCLTRAVGHRASSLILSTVSFHTGCLLSLPPATYLPSMIISCISYCSVILLLSQTISLNCPFAPPAVSLQRRKNLSCRTWCWPSPWPSAQGGSAGPLEDVLQLLILQVLHFPRLYWRKMRVFFMC